MIEKKRINNIENYIGRFNLSDEIYVCVENNDKNLHIFNEKSNTLDFIQEGMQIVPDAVGPSTNFNIYGKRRILKNKEKELRTIARDFHIKDWHGNDHYGTSYDTRMCYPFEFILPPCEQIIVDTNVIRSRILKVNEKETIKHVMNMFLEIFGHCNLLKTDEKMDYSNKIVEIPWHILPKGKRPWDLRKKFDGKPFLKLSNTKKAVLCQRYEFFKNYNPSFIGVGTESFRGYLVYGFEDVKLYFLESIETGNATYVFRDDWKTVSKLTKKDIISKNLCYKRLIHNERWVKDVSDLMNKHAMIKEIIERPKMIKSNNDNHPGYGAGDGDIERYEYECPCGEGRIIEEHDNIPGFRDHSVYIQCSICEKKYQIDTSNGVRNWKLVPR